MKKLLFFIWATGLLFILPTTSMAFTIGNAHQSGVGYFDKMEIFAIPGYASFDSGFISQEANWTANLVNPGYSVMTGPSDNDVYFTIEFEDPQQSWGVYFITWSGNAKVEIGQWVDLAWTDLGTTWDDSQLDRSAVPEPATMLLLGTGLVGLAGFGRRKLFKK